MWKTHALAVASLVAMTIGWVAVQTGWRRLFPSPCEPDALAGRGGCGGGGCGESCDERGSRPACGPEEGSR